MNIVINTGSLSKSIQYFESSFIKKCFLKIAALHPEHTFFFIADSINDKDLASKNSSIIAATPRSSTILLWKIWYSYKLPGILKKYKADVFVNIDSISSFKTNVPQCLLVTDLSLSEKNSFLRKNTGAFLKKATSVICFSQFEKNKICKQYTTVSEKVEMIYTVASENFLDIDDKDITKEKYTEGKEYFLFIGELTPANNLINLLKAFSFFKKRQKSNMQLIIATKTMSKNEAFLKSLKIYKYRNDVKLILDAEQEELMKITTAAYAFIYTTQQTGFYMPVLQAMQCGIPVIVSNTPVMNEICGDAALFTDPAVFENIADKMMLVFKDENKRNELIINGKKQSGQFSIIPTDQLLWQTIAKCAGIPA